MQGYFFANYRLLMDDKISEHESTNYISSFKEKMAYTHTFTLHMGDYALLERKYDETVRYPVVCRTEHFNVHDMQDSWAFVRVMDENTNRRHGKNVLICSRNYDEMTVFLSSEPYYDEWRDRWRTPSIPYSSTIRAACEAGLVIRGGLPLHASMVEKDGYGVVFLGPSGMGKSTQAKLWEQHMGADFIIGDRPAVRFMDGSWYGYGMPWDGKDGIKRQKKVPVKAFVSLEQAKENKIVRLSRQQAMMVLLNQAMMPMWDDEATVSATSLMGRLASEVPFYHLKNLPNEEATVITYNMINEIKG